MVLCIYCTYGVLYLLYLWCSVSTVLMVFCISLWCSVSPYGVLYLLMVFCISLWCSVSPYGVLYLLMVLYLWSSTLLQVIVLSLFSNLHSFSLCGVRNALKPCSVHVVFCYIPRLILLYPVSCPYHIIFWPCFVHFNPLSFAFI